MAENGEDKAGNLIDNNDIGNEGKMFVGGLSKSTNVDGLREYFEKYEINFSHIYISLLLSDLELWKMLWWRSTQIRNNPVDLGL